MEIGVLAHYRHIIRIETRNYVHVGLSTPVRYADFLRKSVFSANLSTEVSYLPHILRRIDTCLEYENKYKIHFESLTKLHY